MNLELFVYASGVLALAVFITCLYGAYKSFKTGNKFIGFILLLASVAEGLGIYALYGERITKLFQ